MRVAKLVEEVAIVVNNVEMQHTKVENTA